LERYLPWAAAIDVELRSAGAWDDLLERSRAARVRRIVSYHDFSGTPPLAALRKVVRRAASAGADVVKIATLLRSPDDLCTLLRLQASTTAVPLATMGMGPLGKVSRLVLGAAGSRLNYGYLDKPQVPGQWPAAELAQRLREVAP
jgi:3-dehydroquinate dehydratase-1